MLTGATAVSAILSVIFATIVPIIGIVRFAKAKALDYDIPDRSRRGRPFILAIASYLVGFVLLVTIRAPVLLSGLMMAYSLNTSIMFLTTLSWKISIHTAGITGPITFLVFSLGLQWSLLYLIVVPVGLLRIILKQHSLLQVMAGAILSAALSWAQILILVPLIPS